ncbi:MAG: hypothetical protein UV43_C0059G0001, partial [Parcubacteria group bacterium GW2011_GWF2_42_7]
MDVVFLSGAGFGKRIGLVQKNL